MADVIGRRSTSELSRKAARLSRQMDVTSGDVSVILQRNPSVLLKRLFYLHEIEGSSTPVVSLVAHSADRVQSPVFCEIVIPFQYFTE